MADILPPDPPRPVAIAQAGRKPFRSASRPALLQLVAQLRYLLQNPKAPGVEALRERVLEQADALLETA